MHDDDFDLESLKLPDTPMPAPSEYTVRRRQRRDQFVMVPLVWADRLNAARFAATLKVANHLLFQSFKDRRQTMRLANGVMALKGVTRSQKCRALQELEALGLIKVEHRPRKSPEVTLLYPGD
jgi:hypothetical protein